MRALACAALLCVTTASAQPTSVEPAAAPGPAAAEPDAPASIAPSSSPTPAPEASATAPAESSAPTAPAGPAAPTATTTTEPATPATTEASTTFGDPIPLTVREPTLKAGTFMGGVRYGLVGTGPTRFVNDLRYAFTDQLELRTSLGPWPAALMLRGRLGSQHDAGGALVLEGGLAWFDAGVRLQEDTGEASVGARLHFEGSVGWSKALSDRFAVSAFAHYRERVSFLDDDGQHAAAVDAHVTFDLLPNIAVAGGLGFATTLGSPVREVVVNFVETEQPGISHLLARDDGHEQSLTVPLSLTYGRVDSFDVDVFATPRVFPEFGIVFGAGVRFRLEHLFGAPKKATTTAPADAPAPTPAPGST